MGGIPFDFQGVQTPAEETAARQLATAMGRL